MANLARTIKGRMIILMNDISEMRRAFARLRMELAYTVGGGRPKAGSGELVILSW